MICENDWFDIPPINDSLLQLIVECVNNMDHFVEYLLLLD